MLPNLADWIIEHTADRAKPLLSTPSGEYSMEDIGRETIRYENLLKPYGSLKGKKVGLLVPPVFHYLSLVFAVNRLGGVVVPISPYFRKEDLGALLEFLDPHVVFTAEQYNGFPFAQAVKEWAGGSGKQTVLFRLSGDGKWTEEECEGVERPAEAIPAHIISCSSGSTGVPKGIMVTTSWFEHNKTALTLLHEFAPSDRLFSLVPAAGNYGLSVILAGLYNGVHVTVAESYDFPSLVKLMAEKGCNKLSATPSLFKALALFAKHANPAALERIELCALAGEPVRDDAFAVFSELPNCKFRNHYGMSELAGLLYSENDVRDGPDMKLLPGVSCKLVDSDGDTGEVAFKVASGFAGYYKRPDLTDEVFRDGWFYTGDIARLSEEDRIAIVGRIKDLIKKGGQQVVPAEIERLLAAHPKVKQAVVVGAPHKILGEQIVAFIVPERQLALQELYSYLEGRIAKYKVPDQLKLVEQVPVSQGKIDKVTLRKLAAAEFGGV
ncbi:class I adenylate-forming enzyme family protein [Paenibacillus chartarius]|uniref:Class I adenylate-forming enzyme family protein n=1 Tax=Paenibacillus chartarius TaxID=747481 RepID=A0ABV6DLX8_9BACL